MENLPNIFFYIFSRISQCSAIKYLSINFHNNMCMNKTFWFGKYVCTHAEGEHTMCHLSSSHKLSLSEQHAENGETTDEITNHLK